MRHRSRAPHAALRALAVPAIALGALALAGALGPGRRPPTAEEGVAAFGTVYRVLQHPRCLNCHPAGERPLNGDDAEPHPMNVQRGADDAGRPGMRCATCHGVRNVPGERMPPGVETGWKLAPRSTVFEGVSQRELAEMLLDPARSHMDRAELVEHVAHDPLVLWGWAPGEGRPPVDVPHAEFEAAFRTWIDAGAPLPPADEGESEGDAR